MPDAFHSSMTSLRLSTRTAIENAPGPRRSRKRRTGDPGPVGAISDTAPVLPRGRVTSSISTGGSGMWARGRSTSPRARHLASAASMSSVATLRVRNSRMRPILRLFRSLGRRRRLPAFLAFDIDSHGLGLLPHGSDVGHHVLCRPHEVARALEMRDDMAAEHLDRLHDLVVRHAVDAHDERVNAAV